MKLRVYWLAQSISFLLFGVVICWSVIFRSINEIWYPKNIALIICELIVMAFLLVKGFMNLNKQEMLITENISGEMDKQVTRDLEID